MFFSSCFVFHGCKQDSMSEFDASPMDKLISSYNLKATSGNVRSSYNFKSVEEASKFLSNRKSFKKTFRIQDLSESNSLKLKSTHFENQFSITIENQNLPRLKSAQVEGDHETDVAWGLFSTLIIDFSTDSSGSIVAGSISSYTIGIQLSGYEQMGSQIIDGNSFKISANVTYTIGIGDLGYDVTDRVEIIVNCDFENHTATFTMNYLGS